MKKKLMIILCSCLVFLLCGCGDEEYPDVVGTLPEPSKTPTPTVDENGIEHIYIDDVLYELDTKTDQDTDSTNAKPGTYVNECYVGRCTFTNLGELFERGVNIPPARFGSFNEEARIWIDENVPEFNGDIYIDLDHIIEDKMDTTFYIKSDETKTMVKVFFSLGEDTFTFEKVKNY